MEKYFNFIVEVYWKKCIFAALNLFIIKTIKVMNKIETITPQYPDFGALLESVKENGRLMRESADRYYREQAEREKERDAKWEAERKEFRERMDKISVDTNKAIKDMKNVFTTQWGRLVEALCKPAAYSLFKKEGIEIDRVYEGVHKAKVNGQDAMEIDVALCDTSVAVIVEVKTRCGRRDIDYFLDQMKHCKEWYPDFANKELRVAVAAIKYDDGADTYAQERGLYVLKLSGEDTFTMSAPKKPMTF
jgi:hypothetical protein